MIDPIVPADRLPPEAVVLDVRWYLDGRDGAVAYASGHIPGARFVDLDTVLAGMPGGPGGRHPLPDPAAFARALGALGVGDDDVVIAYDDSGSIAAARLAWMLRVLGGQAAVLDGGLAAWPGRLEEGWPAPPDVVERRPRPWPPDATVSADEVIALIAAGGIVGDSRVAARYNGAPHPLDTTSGHIPGAMSLPFPDCFDESGRFASPGELRQRFEDVGVTSQSAFYCGSGVSACVNVLAAERAGLGRPRLYVGSWSGWTADPTRPVDR